MKKSSPDSDSFLDRIRSWATSKAHGPPSLSTSSRRSPSLPLTNQPTPNTQQNNSLFTNTNENATTNVPPFPSTDINGLASQSSNTTGNNVADITSTNNPPPAPPPEADGERTVIETAKPKKKNIAIRFWLTSKSIILSSYINILLVFVPVGIAAKAAGLSPGLIFGMNAIAIVPLAGMLAHATESVAKRMGDTVGALMNVTFGNAVELIIFIALQKNEIRIVQASLLGSILANLLLILGMCFLIGGLRFREQIYNSTVTQMSACLLSLAVMSLLLPTAFHASFSTNQEDMATISVLKVSRGTSVILLWVYLLYLLFQLKSHAYMYESTPQHIIDEELAPGPISAWMESSDSDDDSSSSSDSDGSSGSNTTAKRFKKVIRGGRRRRKSSAGSKETADAAISQTPSVGTSSNIPAPAEVLSDQPLGLGHRPGTTDFADDGGDEKKQKGSSRGPSRQNSHHSYKERIMSKKERKRERKRQERQQRKKFHRNGDGAIIEGVVDNTSSEKPPEDEIVVEGPRRIDFAIVNSEENDPTQKRPFTLRGITSIRPQIPKTFSQNVFMQPSPIPPPTSSTGPIPRVRYGIRRTNSLPDRLNQSYSGPTRTAPQCVVPVQGTSVTKAKQFDEEEENISRTTAIFLLLISTGLVAVCAEFMVDSINAVVSGNSGLSEAFIGLIILPIVGNAAEHVTAVTVASKNKMDLAIGVAVGSSIQIALFVTPFIVLLGWCMDKEMSLYFTLFETVSLFVSAFIVNFLVLDGRSNYLEGALLCAAYIIIAVGAFFYPSLEDESNLGGNAGATKMMVRSLGLLVRL